MASASKAARIGEEYASIHVNNEQLLTRPQSVEVSPAPTIVSKYHLTTLQKPCR